jgi:tryptophan-rich sensory protein
MKNLKLLIGCLMLAFTPALSGAAVRPGEWYNSLRKSSLNPPGWVFAPVWTVLYTTMGIAHYRYCIEETATDKTASNLLYALQLLLNGTWSLVFFGRRAPRLAFLNIMLLAVTIVVTMVKFRRVSQSAAWLLLPYLIWVGFASYLNFEICRLNEG